MSVGPTSWEAYSRPVSIHADGRTPQEVRQAFAAAAEAHFGPGGQTIEVVEHRELLVLPDVYVRIATDRWTLDRERVAAVLRPSLTVPAQLEMLEASNPSVASTGDVVFVACVEPDRPDTPATAPNRATRRRREKTKSGGALMRPRRRVLVAA